MMSHHYFTEQVVSDHQRALVDQATEHRLAKKPSDSSSGLLHRVMRPWRLAALRRRRFTPTGPITGRLSLHRR